MLKRTNFFILSLLILFMGNCANPPEKTDISELVYGEDSSVEIENPKIVFSENLVYLNDDEGTSFEISLDKTVSDEIEWEITESPPWIELEPTSGTIGNDPLLIKIFSDIKDLSMGYYSRDVEFQTENGEISTLHINQKVSSGPQATFNPTSLTITENIDEATIALTP